MATPADAAVFRWAAASRRKIVLRRRKPAIIRLGGGKNNSPRGGFSLKRIVRRMRLRWLKLYYVRLVKKIRGYYRNLAKEFAEAGAGLEAIQQRMAVEAAAFAVPGFGLSFSSISGHDRARYFLV